MGFNRMLYIWGKQKNTSDYRLGFTMSFKTSVAVSRVREGAFTAVVACIS
jgi:hypothetical protein